jgi:hypothetical protein
MTSGGRFRHAVALLLPRALDALQETRRRACHTGRCHKPERDCRPSPKPIDGRLPVPRKDERGGDQTLARRSIAGMHGRPPAAGLPRPEEGRAPRRRRPGLLHVWRLGLPDHRPALHHACQVGIRHWLQRRPGFCLASFGDSALPAGSMAAYALLPSDSISSSGITLVGPRLQRSAWLQVAACAPLPWVATGLTSLTGGQPARFSWQGKSRLGIAICAVSATAVAFSIQLWARQYTTSGHAAILFTLQPVYASATSCILLRERLGNRALLGGLCACGHPDR